MGRHSTTQGLPQPATLSLSGRAARASRSAHAGTGAPRPNTRPWGIDAILARAAGGLGSGIATRTALQPGQIITIPSEDCFWHRNGNVTCNKWTKVFVSDQAGRPLPFATGNFLGHGWVRSKYIQPSSSESGGC